MNGKLFLFLKEKKLIDEALSLKMNWTKVKEWRDLLKYLNEYRNQWCQLGFEASVCPSSTFSTVAGCWVWGSGSKTKTETLAPLSPVRWKWMYVPATTWVWTQLMVQAEWVAPSLASKVGLRVWIKFLWWSVTYWDENPPHIIFLKLS